MDSTISSPPESPETERIRSFLGPPTWSTSDLVDSKDSIAQISPQQLHHLLRLSALPLPTSPAQERKMLAMLQSQLRFVRTIQEIDVDDVEPLQSIRDETAESRKEMEIGLEELKGEFEKEEVVGKRGRIRRKAEELVVEEDENWDVFAGVRRRVGRYIAVETDKD
ncbi:MAG: hypothetical protein Q9214_001327 [Letrouitia sp. 1 TL-2023]